MENFERIELEQAPNEKGMNEFDKQNGEMWKKALEDDLELDGNLENLPI